MHTEHIIHTVYEPSPIVFTIKDYPPGDDRDSGFHVLTITTGTLANVCEVKFYLPWGAANVDTMSIREVAGALRERRKAGA